MLGSVNWFVQAYQWVFPLSVDECLYDGQYYDYFKLQDEVSGHFGNKLDVPSQRDDNGEARFTGDHI